MRSRNVEELEKKIEAGDYGAAWELLKLATDGDQAAKEAIVRGVMAKKRAEECEEVAQNREQLNELIAFVDSHPRKARPLVDQALLEPHGACYRVQLLGARAQIERACGDLAAAERTLAKAWDVGRYCLGSQADVLRRQSRFVEARGRPHEALKKLEEALALYEVMGSPGHDPDGNGIANCLFRRGQVKDVCFGEVAGAIADFSECLRILKPTEAPDLYDYTLRSLAYELSLTGDPESEELAFDMISEARRRYHGVEEPSVPRAKLDWMEAQMRWRRRDRTDRAKDLFFRAQGDFIHPLGLAEEAAAVSADIFLVHLRDQDFILGHFEKMRQPFEQIFSSPKLRAALNAVQDAAERAVWETAELERAIHALRASVSDAPGVLCCLLKSR